MIALLEFAVGNSILKVPLLAVLSPPNAIAQTASVVPEPPSVVVLYMSAPFAVKEADEKVTSEKSVKAVVLDNDTPEFVRVAPPALYADPDVFVISSEVE